MHALSVIFMFFTLSACLLIMQGFLWYSQLYDKKVHRVKEEDNVPKIKGQDYRKDNMLRKIYPRFSLDDVEPDWNKNALLTKRRNNTRRYLTMGIVTAKRPNSIIYLYETLDSLLMNADTKDKESITILILLADFDDEWRQNISEEIQAKYSDDIQNGTIQLLQTFHWIYPKLNNLTHHYIEHSEHRVSWMAKQNIDFAFLWLYVFKENSSRFYLHLEDDVITVPDYFKDIKNYIVDQKDRWTCLEFSELGMIAKLYHTYDLNKLAQIVTLFYEEQPADFTYLYFNPQMLQFKRLIRKPTLFQHIGRSSSLPGKMQKLQDRFFLLRELQWKNRRGDNPPAEFETNLPSYSGFAPSKAYSPGYAFFWSKSAPRKKDYFRLRFKSPQLVSRIIILSGSWLFPKDMFHYAVVETSATLTNRTCCVDFKVIGQFEKGKIDMRHVFDPSKPIHCIQVRVFKSQQYWVRIQEIAVFLLH